MREATKQEYARAIQQAGGHAEIRTMSTNRTIDSQWSVCGRLIASCTKQLKRGKVVAEYYMVAQ